MRTCYEGLRLNRCLIDLGIGAINPEKITDFNATNVTARDLRVSFNRVRPHQVASMSRCSSGLDPVEYSSSTSVVEVIDEELLLSLNTLLDSVSLPKISHILDATPNLLIALYEGLFRTRIPLVDRSRTSHTSFASRVKNIKLLIGTIAHEVLVGDNVGVELANVDPRRVCEKDMVSMRELLWVLVRIGRQRLDGIGTGVQMDIGHQEETRKPVATIKSRHLVKESENIIQRAQYSGNDTRIPEDRPRRLSGKASPSYIQDTEPQFVHQNITMNNTVFSVENLEAVSSSDGDDLEDSDYAHTEDQLYTTTAPWKVQSVPPATPPRPNERALGSRYTLKASISPHTPPPRSKRSPQAPPLESPLAQATSLRRRLMANIVASPPPSKMNRFTETSPVPTMFLEKMSEKVLEISRRMPRLNQFPDYSSSGETVTRTLEQDAKVGLWLENQHELSLHESVTGDVSEPDSESEHSSHDIEPDYRLDYDPNEQETIQHTTTPITPARIPPQEIRYDSAIALMSPAYSLRSTTDDEGVLIPQENAVNAGRPQSRASTFASKTTTQNQHYPTEYEDEQSDPGSHTTDYLTLQHALNLPLPPSPEESYSNSLSSSSSVGSAEASVVDYPTKFLPTPDIAETQFFDSVLSALEGVDRSFRMMRDMTTNVDVQNKTLGSCTMDTHESTVSSHISYLAPIEEGDVPLDEYLEDEDTQIQPQNQITPPSQQPVPSSQPVYESETEPLTQQSLNYSDLGFQSLSQRSLCSTPTPIPKPTIDHYYHRTSPKPISTPTPSLPKSFSPSELFSRTVPSIPASLFCDSTSRGSRSNSGSRTPRPSAPIPHHSPHVHLPGESRNIDNNFRNERTIRRRGHSIHDHEERRCPCFFGGECDVETCTDMDGPEEEDEATCSKSVSMSMVSEYFSPTVRDVGAYDHQFNVTLEAARIQAQVIRSSPLQPRPLPLETPSRYYSAEACSQDEEEDEFQTPAPQQAPTNRNLFKSQVPTGTISRSKPQSYQFAGGDIITNLPSTDECSDDGDQGNVAEKEAEEESVAIDDSNGDADDDYTESIVSHFSPILPPYASPRSSDEDEYEHEDEKYSTTYTEQSHSAIEGHRLLQQQPIPYRTVTLDTLQEVWQREDGETNHSLSSRISTVTWGSDTPSMAALRRVRGERVKERLKGMEKRTSRASPVQDYEDQAATGFFEDDGIQNTTTSQPQGYTSRSTRLPSPLLPPPPPPFKTPSRTYPNPNDTLPNHIDTTAFYTPISPMRTAKTEPPSSSFSNLYHTPSNHTHTHSPLHYPPKTSYHAQASPLSNVARPSLSFGKTPCTNLRGSRVSSGLNHKLITPRSNFLSRSRRNNLDNTENTPLLTSNNPLPLPVGSSPLAMSVPTITTTPAKPHLSPLQMQTSILTSRSPTHKTQNAPYSSPSTPLYRASYKPPQRSTQNKSKMHMDDLFLPTLPYTLTLDTVDAQGHEYRQGVASQHENSSGSVTESPESVSTVSSSSYLSSFLRNKEKEEYRTTRQEEEAEQTNPAPSPINTNDNLESLHYLTLLELQSQQKLLEEKRKTLIKKAAATGASPSPIRTVPVAIGMGRRGGMMY